MFKIVLFDWQRQKHPNRETDWKWLRTLFLTLMQLDKLKLCSRLWQLYHFIKHPGKRNKNIPLPAIAMHSHQLLSCPQCGHGWLSAGLANTVPCIWSRTWAYIPLGSLLPLSPHHHNCPTSLLKQAAPSAGGQISWAAVRASWGGGGYKTNGGKLNTCTAKYLSAMLYNVKKT